MTDKFHRITVEVPPESLPPARPSWHATLVDALLTLRASDDLTARGVAVLLEKLRLAEPKSKGRAA